MQESIYLKKFKQLSSKFIKIIKLDKIDQNQSLTFLHRNYRVHPSQIISIAALLIMLLILLLDGFNFIASIVCFLVPLIQCLTKMGGIQSKKSMNFIYSQQQPGSKLTDEEFSQIISSNKKQQSAVNVYIVYFICYAVLEVLAFVILWILTPFSWLIIRCAFAYFMLSKKTAGASKLLGMMKKEGQMLIEKEVAHRKADLFQKW